MNQPKRRRRRRLKPWVKKALIYIGVISLVLIIRPWRIISDNWFAVSNTSAHTAESNQAPQTPSINQRVTNSDSEIPEAAKFDRTVENFMRKWEVAGASLAIMKNGSLIYSKGYGFADTLKKEATEVKHIFRVASVSKLITAVGIMKLYEQGKLSLNGHVFGPKGILSEYGGYTDKKLETITVEHLLRHRGGFTIKAGDPMFDPAKFGISLPATPGSIIAHVLKHGIRYTPGSTTAYSNVGYLILSEIITKTTGIPYEKYIKDSILTPIGCYDMHIGISDPNKRHSNEVCYYETKDAESAPAADGSGRMLAKSRGGNNIELLSGAGGWVASPVEILKLVAAIDYQNPHKSILKTSTIKLMTAYDKGMLPIGWSNVNENGDWWRSGAMAGTNAMLRRQHNGYTWIFVTNTSSWKGHRFAGYINTMLQSAFGKVTDWPEKDLFQNDNE